MSEATSGEPLFERLPTCEYGVDDYSRWDCTSACGEPATYRVSWDDGKTWLIVCEKHADVIELESQERTDAR